MNSLAIIGCGFVADLYMRSLKAHPNVTVAGVFDRSEARLDAFAKHWGVTACNSLDQLFDSQPERGLILNLTNPREHFTVNQACLNAGFHVYSEKPLATEMEDAHRVHALAQDLGLMLASAPCSVLGEAAQTLAKAVREDVAGTPRLIYAELDDGFVPQARYKDWISESGAPWPHEDEFITGCTLEHAGYYLSWLIAMFGSVRTVVAASAGLVPGKVSGGNAAPDFSVATLYFEAGMVARLTCSIVAPHDHQIRIIGDKGVLRVNKAWDNGAPVKFHRRFNIRRRLLEHPIGRRIKLGKPSHPKVGRWGAASMNFALGPVEMLDAIRENRPCRLSADFALHLNEVTLAIQNAGETTGAQTMTTRCEKMEPMTWAA